MRTEKGTLIVKVLTFLVAALAPTIYGIVSITAIEKLKSNYSFVITAEEEQSLFMIDIVLCNACDGNGFSMIQVQPTYLPSYQILLNNETVCLFLPLSQFQFSNALVQEIGYPAVLVNATYDSYCASQGIFVLADNFRYQYFRNLGDTTIISLQKVITKYKTGSVTIDYNPTTESSIEKDGLNAIALYYRSMIVQTYTETSQYSNSLVYGIVAQCFGIAGALFLLRRGVVSLFEKSIEKVVSRRDKQGSLQTFSEQLLRHGPERL